MLPIKFTSIYLQEEKLCLVHKVTLLCIFARLVMRYENTHVPPKYLWKAWTSVYPDCLIKCTVLISELKIPPTFTKKPSEHFEETEGTLVNLESRVFGTQPLSISWYKDNKQISSSDNCEMSFIGNEAVLCIKNSQTSDSGTYTCSASNEAGTTSFNVVMSITGTDNLVYSLYWSSRSLLAFWPLCMVCCSENI